LERLDLGFHFSAEKESWTRKIDKVFARFFRVKEQFNECALRKVLTGEMCFACPVSAFYMWVGGRHVTFREGGRLIGCGRVARGARLRNVFLWIGNVGICLGCRGVGTS
jgi:hypothetical protein